MHLAHPKRCHPVPLQPYALPATSDTPLFDNQPPNARRLLLATPVVLVEAPPLAPSKFYSPAFISLSLSLLTSKKQQPRPSMSSKIPMQHQPTKDQGKSKNEKSRGRPLTTHIIVQNTACFLTHADATPVNPGHLSIPFRGQLSLSYVHTPTPKIRPLVPVLRSLQATSRRRILCVLALRPAALRKKTSALGQPSISRLCNKHEEVSRSTPGSVSRRIVSPLLVSSPAVQKPRTSFFPVDTRIRTQQATPLSLVAQARSSPTGRSTHRSERYRHSCSMCPPYVPLQRRKQCLHQQ